MAYKAWCNTAVHTKWWITGTGSVINRLSEVMDDNPAGVEEDDNPGNFQPWTEFMTEVVEDAVYLIHQYFEIGDATTPTTLLSPNEMVRFDDNKYFATRNNATLQKGELSGDWGVNGSTWSVSHTGNVNLAGGGNFLMYGSCLKDRGSGYLYFFFGNVDIRNSILTGSYDGSIDQRFFFHADLDSLKLQHVYINNSKFIYLAHLLTADSTNLWLHRVFNAPLMHTADNLLIGLKVTSFDERDIHSINVDAELRDPRYTITSPQIDTAGKTITESYTCNIHIANKDGANLASATILCEDTNGTQVFSVSTDANGDIAEQVINYRIWTGTSEDLVTYSPHKFTISKAGKETLVMENITVDALIAWKLELQNAGSQRPRLQIHGI